MNFPVQLCPRCRYRALVVPPALPPGTNFCVRMCRKCGFPGLADAAGVMHVIGEGEWAAMEAEGKAQLFKERVERQLHAKGLWG